MSASVPARREPGSLRQYLRFAVDGPKLLPFAKGSPALRVRHWARKTPDALAIAYGERRLSWREVDEAADRYAIWLANDGIRAGDVVALVMDNRPEFLISFTALSRIGAVAALINTHLRGESLLHSLRTSRARLILAGSEHLDALLEVLGQLEEFVPDKGLVLQLDDENHDPRGHRLIDESRDSASESPGLPVVTPRLSDLCCYVYTSGTTGLPKAALIRNQRILGGGFTFGHLMHRIRRGDLIYVALPLYHSSALFLGWGSCLATGCSIGLRRHFSASGFWDDVRSYGATSFLYIGELCRYLLAAPPTARDRDHSLRTGVGNGLRPDVWREFQERFAIPKIREFYGATEGNVPLLNQSGRPGMLGRRQRGQLIVRCDETTGEPLRNVAGFCIPVATHETGLLLGRISRFLAFDGYADEKATRKKILSDVQRKGDHYFDTGDLVTIHEGGWLSFADRVGDTFRWKGENVSTQEVADVLARIPEVEESLVYGVEVPGYEGRAGMAALKMSESFDATEFSSFARDTLSHFQRPVFVRVFDRPLETTSTFKRRSVDYRNEGFDPRAIEDPMFVKIGGDYLPLDAARFDSIVKSEMQIG